MTLSREGKSERVRCHCVECLSILTPWAPLLSFVGALPVFPRCWLGCQCYCFVFVDLSLGDKDLVALLLTCLPCPYWGHAVDMMQFFFLCVYFVLRGTSRGSIELLRSLSGPLGGVSGPWGIPLLCFLGASLEGLTPGLVWVLIWSTLLQKPRASASHLLSPYLLLSSYFCGIFPLVASQEIMRGSCFREFPSIPGKTFSAPISHLLIVLWIVTYGLATIACRIVKASHWENNGQYSWISGMRFFLMLHIKSVSKVEFISFVSFKSATACLTLNNTLSFFKKWFFCLFLFAVLEIEPRVLHMLGKCSIWAMFLALCVLFVCLFAFKI